jgi:general stress protein 26
MHPAPFEVETQVNLYFIANKASPKVDDIEHDANVNVSFFNPISMDWVSYAGKARVSQDQSLIQKYWTHSFSTYFGDLKDGVHKGDQMDPRVAVIEVIPDEIRYWVATKSTIARTSDTVVAFVSGGVSPSGELRAINANEFF